ncbi:hypothetical protein [Nocardia carnea]|uniref:hypothetical protein n=1 Tax=Nocardia carnea TaxID=37328 RepID=UPI002458461D|nr:hypothetical protein [Nocardia carnea]
MTAEPGHGTYTAWQRHLRNAEKVCPDCARYAREWMRGYRARKNPPKKTYVSTRLLVQLIAAAPFALKAEALAEFGRPVMTVWGLIPEETP